MRRAVGLCIVVSAIACGDGTTDPPQPDPPRATTVVVTPATTELAALGTTVQLTAEVRDQNGQAMAGAAVSWASSEAGVATVASSGLVTAAGNGAATITATAGSASGSAAVAVAQVVAAVTVSPAADTLVAFGDTVRLTAEAFDANGHVVTGSEFAWLSSDTLVARVDETGLVESAAEGAVEVTATASGVTGRAELSVVPPRPTTVAVSADTLRFTALGQTAQLAVEVREQAGRAMAEALVSWASGDTLVAAVDSAGLVTAMGGGTTTVSATAGEVSGAVVVTVTQATGSVVVTPASGAVALGDTLRLAAEAFDENGHRVDGAAFAWSSSDASVATVDDAGLVRARSEGTATITAAAGNVRGAAEITVVNPDRAALVALYEATDGPNWVNSENWLTDAPLRDWYGVDTDASGRVVSLGLYGRWDERSGHTPHGLRGPIPPELGSLTALVNLDLSGNGLTGPIPRELGNLANLETLRLGNNPFTGSIPVEIGGLRRLRHLWIGGNRLTGPIPAELGNLANLRWLGLGWSNLEGSIPAELGNLADLRSLGLSYNSLSGPIPPELGDIESMEELWLDNNDLTGAIPPNLLRLDGLRRLHIAENAGLCAPGTTAFATWLQRLDATDAGDNYCNRSDRALLEMLYETAVGSGWTSSDGWLGGPVLEEWYGVTADSLGRAVALDLAGNALSGQLPRSLGELALLTELRISDNPGLSGPLPVTLARLSLHTLHYGGTGLCVPVGAPLRRWLSGLPSHEGTGAECVSLLDREVLSSLYHAADGPSWRNNENWLTDAPLGDWHGVEVDGAGNVVRIELSQNNLSGRIPPEIGDLAHLASLSLRSNGIAGSIPPELGSLAELAWIDLSENALLGSIPPELGNIRSLERLHLWGNSLSGSIPPELGNLSHLDWLSFEYNDLVGAIPPELGKLERLRGMSLTGNRLSGAIPPELGNLANLRILSLAHNALTGPIPPELSNLSRLDGLFLDGNGLSGPIPAQLGGLGNLRHLMLSANRLAGRIPPELGELSRLTEMDISYNSLAGPIPPELGDLSALERLRLGHNRLEGAVPARLAELTSLRELSLVNNPDLSGGIARRFDGTPTARSAADGSHGAMRAPRTRFYRLARECPKSVGGPLRRRVADRVLGAGGAVARIPRTAGRGPRGAVTGVSHGDRHDRRGNPVGSSPLLC